MERGFNDDELADIMNEIESLEQEFSEDDGPTEDPVVASAASDESEQEDDSQQVDDAQSFAEEVDAETQEVLDELSDMPVENVVPMSQQSSAADREVHHSRSVHSAPTTSGAETSMNFSVSGEMTVNLSFQVGNEIVSLSVSEDEGLVIQMNNGVTLSLPIGDVSSVKKAS